MGHFRLATEPKEIGLAIRKDVDHVREPYVIRKKLRSLGSELIP
jgi:cobalamin biosynthesis protein CbiG